MKNHYARLRVLGYLGLCFVAGGILAAPRAYCAETPEHPNYQIALQVSQTLPKTATSDSPSNPQILSEEALGGGGLESVVHAASIYASENLEQLTPGAPQGLRDKIRGLLSDRSNVLAASVAFLSGGLVVYNLAPIYVSGSVSQLELLLLMAWRIAIDGAWAKNLGKLDHFFKFNSQGNQRNSYSELALRVSINFLEACIYRIMTGSLGASHEITTLAGLIEVSSLAILTGVMGAFNNLVRNRHGIYSRDIVTREWTALTMIMVNTPLASVYRHVGSGWPLLVVVASVNAISTWSLVLLPNQFERIAHWQQRLLNQLAPPGSSAAQSRRHFVTPAKCAQTLG